MKVKRIISLLLMTVICSLCFSVNVSAYNLPPLTSFESKISENALPGQSSTTYSVADNGYKLTLAKTWTDSMKVTWKVGKKTAYHSLTSSISTVYYSGYYQLSSYKNHNGTYNNVYVLKVSPYTLFASSDITYTTSSYIRIYTDYITGQSTPRRISSSDLSDLESCDDYCYIIYNANTNTIIDFYSYLNPIIYYGWSKPTFVL